MSRDTFTKAELKTAFRCGYQHMFRWVEGIKVRPTFAQAASQGAKAGIALALENHGAMSENLEVVCETAAQSTVQEAVDVEGVRDPYGQTKEQLQQARESAIKKARRSTKIFTEQLQPMLPETLTANQAWKLRIDGIGELTGAFDAVDPRCIPVASRLYHPPIEFDEELRQDPLLMLDAYVGDCLEPSGKKVAPIILADIRIKGASDVENIVAEEEDMERALDRVEAHVNAIQKGVVVPVSHDSWTCNKEYCGYYEDICPYGRRNRTKPGAET